MADMKDGFSVSFKAGADMLTVQGVDYATFKKNLEELFGDEAVPSALARFVDSTALANVAAFVAPVTPAVAPPAPAVDSGAGDNVGNQERTGNGGDSGPEGTHDFAVCGAPTANGPCGSLKNEWKPGGKRANGTTYQGFWGCPDWKTHLKGRK